MDIAKDRIQQYEQEGEYKGFREVRSYDRPNVVQLTLSDGDREFSASGRFRKDALKRVFNKIDAYYAVS
jgi:hypothetical protein